MDKKNLAIVLGFLAVFVLIGVNMLGKAATPPSPPPPQINASFRFNNFTYNATTKKGKVDLEAKLGEFEQMESAEILGGNIRMFYSDKFLPGNATNTKIVDLASGYKLHAPNPPIFGNSPSAGIPWFHFPTLPARYVNGAFIHDGSSNHTYINKTTWTKLFAIEVTSGTVLTGLQCPPFIIDKETNPAYGGFIPGSDGLTMSYVIDPTHSGPVFEVAEQHLNWTATPGAITYPWGDPNSNNCVTLP